ncbi:MAG: ion channel [Pseudolabrys sp.]
MGSQLFAGVAVSLLNFAIHGVITGLIVIATRHTAHVTSERGMFIRLSALLTVTMVALMCAHMVEIAVWTAYYALSDLQVKGASLFEFAFENYTALGYGDVLPPEGSRLIGPITSLNGLLLIGWSVAVIFEVMRMAELQFGRRRS